MFLHGFWLCYFGFWLYYLDLITVLVVSGFNLSPKHAVIFKDPSGQEGSYFGYTVALQQDGWLLVGAPRGISTYPNHVNITEPGMVYQCRIGGEANCASQILDSAGNDRNEQNKYLQHKHNAWAGGSLDVIDGKNGDIAVCGPRWVNLLYENKQRDSIPGICYLTDVSKYKKNAEKLLPLNNYTHFFYHKKRGDPDNLKSVSYYYVFGQFGMSVHFTREGEEMIIGAPGVMDWTGTVVRYNTKDRRIPVIPNPLRTTELRNYSYMGYSVSSGNFISGKNKTYYVSGAPRGGKEYQGTVYVFDIRNTTPTGDEYQIQIIRELLGRKAGEYFGAALCVLDVNDDGIDDILVGAPHYGSAKTWDQGRVHLFLTKNIMEDPPFDSFEIFDHRQSGSQFGTAVSSLGDINKDGYNDYVVGAPFENSGTGVIYIYHGGKERPSSYSQRIVGSEIRPGILGFGISFSRGLDIDGNNYNDIAVGAYKSGHAVVLKTRPIIRYEASITPNVSSIGFHATSFKIKVCLSYKGRNVPSNVATKVTLTLDRRVRPQYINYDVTVPKSTSICNNHSVEIEVSLHDFSKPIQLKMGYMPIGESNGEIFCKNCPMVDPNRPSSVKSALPYATGCDKDDRCLPSLSITAKFIDVVLPLIIGSQPTVSMNVTVQNWAEPAFLAYAQILLPASCPLVRLPQSCEISDIYVDDDEAARHPEIKKKLLCLVGNPLSKGKKRTVQLEFDVKEIASGTEGFFFSMTTFSAGMEQTPNDNSYNVTLSCLTQTDIGLSGVSDRNEIILPKRNAINETKMEFSHFYEVTNFGPSPLEKVDLKFKIPVSYAEFENLFRIDDIKMSNDGTHISCSRSDTGLVSRIQFFNLANNSEPADTTDQIDFSDTTSPKFSYTTESGNTWKFEDTTERNNASTSENTDRTFRSINIANDLPGPEPTQPTEGKVLIDCKDPETTCVTVNCSLHGTIRNMSKASISFIISATIDDLESVLGSRSAIIYSTTGKAIIRNPKNVQQAEVNSADEKDVVTILHARIKAATFDPSVLVWAVAGAALVLIIIILILWKCGFFKRKLPEDQYRALIKKPEDE